MKDCLGNTVTNFVPNEGANLKKDQLERYLHGTLVSSTRFAVRVYDVSGKVLGWNMVPRK